ncbi:hypothetical protein IQ06DRAFT_215980 [Phaeosphaeriaceae sp. SRC1lsM3a]|nr:hypothetical protein IQ06DRAFT_215980 [Stagonospora sp. SRC1lsM3a]
MEWQDANSDAHLEAVDLTLSSPEPEPRSSRILQQQRIPTHFKSEPSSSSRTRRMRKHRVRTSETHHHDSLLAAAMDPEHLSRIINTSSSTAIKGVLLELCKLSPALSGAVARGLAAHSTFAQDLITKHHHAPRQPASRNVKSEHSLDQDAYERMKQRLAPRLAAQTSTKHCAQPPSSTSEVLASRPFASRSTDSTKQLDLVNLGNSDSDNDSYIPREFPLYGELPLPTSRSRQHSARSVLGSSSTTQARNLSQQGALNEPAQKTCVNCLDRLEEYEESDVCFYHKGPKIEIDSTRTCGSCMKAWSGPTCEIGTHSTTR